MKVEILFGKDENDSAKQSLSVNGENKVYVQALWDCPEDATIERDLVSCQTIRSLMREAWEAGKSGEVFEQVDGVMDDE